MRTLIAGFYNKAIINREKSTERCTSLAIYRRLTNVVISQFRLARKESATRRTGDRFLMRVNRTMTLQLVLVLSNRIAI